MNQLKAGAFLNYIVIVLNTLVGLLYTPYMLRMMGQSEYGLYALVASVISYLTVLDLGLGNAIVRYTAKFRAQEKKQEQYEMFGMFFVLYLFIGFISLIVGLCLYFNVDNMFGDTMTEIELDHARVMMLILVFNLAFTFPMSIFGSIMTAYERFVFPKVINIFRVLLNTAIMIVLLSMGYKAIAMVVLQSIFNFTTLIINYIYCKKKIRIKIVFGKIKWLFLKEIAIYSFWIFVNVIMDKVYWSTGQFILGVVSGTIAISVYAIAIHLQSIYMSFSTAISSVFLPRVTSMITVRNDKKEISDLFIRTGRIQNIIMALILFGFITFGRQFIFIWAGPDYDGAYIIAVIFFVALYVPLIQNLGITILQARNQMKFRSLLYIIIAIVALFLEFFSAKLWGGIGCAIVIGSALLFGHGLIMNVYYNNKQDLDVIKFWIEIVKMDIIPIIVSLGFILFLQRYNIINLSTMVFMVVLYLIVYIPLFYVFSMNKSERDLFLVSIQQLVKRVNRKGALGGEVYHEN